MHVCLKQASKKRKLEKEKNIFQCHHKITEERQIVISI